MLDLLFSHPFHNSHTGCKIAAEVSNLLVETSSIVYILADKNRDDNYFITGIDATNLMNGSKDYQYLMVGPKSAANDHVKHFKQGETRWHIYGPALLAAVTTHFEDFKKSRLAIEVTGTKDQFPTVKVRSVIIPDLDIKKKFESVPYMGSS